MTFATTFTSSSLRWAWRTSRVRVGSIATRPNLQITLILGVGQPTRPMMDGPLRRNKLSGLVHEKPLIDGAAHELRTPLTSLRSFIELLSTVRPLSSKDRNVLMTDLSEQMEVSDLVADLDALVRDRGDETSSEQRPLRPDGIVSNALRRAQRRAGATIAVCDHGAGVVTGNAAMLERAIMNVLDNAVKWSPDDGTVASTSSTRPSPPSTADPASASASAAMTLPACSTDSGAPPPGDRCPARAAAGRSSAESSMTLTAKSLSKQPLLGRAFVRISLPSLAADASAVRRSTPLPTFYRRRTRRQITPSHTRRSPKDRKRPWPRLVRCCAHPPRRRPC
ncbi:MAG: histidine kinase [Ilumatobacteraceae bacterium]|nr:histidine kinase [Ilumatobacteraceae bacterium]